jgi:thiol-disulfide isomerase/thioredoxin
MNNSRSLAILLAFLLLSTIVLAQKVIINPNVGFDGKNPNLKIKKVTLNSTETILEFTTTSNPGSWIRIPKITYIQSEGSSKKLFIVRTDGIPLNEKFTMPTSGTTTYQLVFPPIDQKTALLDYGENEDDGWKIYDIELIKKPARMSAFLYKEWYDQTNSKLLIGFYPKAVVFDQKVWTYQKIVSQGKGYDITLMKDKMLKQIHVEACNTNKLRLKVNKSIFCLSTNKETCRQVLETDTFKLPLFDRKDAIFSGYIKNYSPKLGKTISVYINNIIIGTQHNILIEINPDGSFSQRIPINYCQEVFLESDLLANGSIYLEPGKELFLIGGNGKEKYQGTLSQINEHLSMAQSMRFFNYDPAGKILSVSPTEYKNYLLGLQLKEHKTLDSLYQNKIINAKAYQIAKRNIICSYVNQLALYKWTYRKTYIQLQKMNRNAEVEVPELPADYYNFIKGSVCNDELNLIASEFYTLINRLEYLDGLSMVQYTYNYHEILKALTESGYTLNDNDNNFKKLLSKNGVLVTYNNPQDTSIHKTFNQTHEDFINELYNEIKAKYYFRKLDSAFQIKDGILVDLIRSRKIGAPIVEQSTPMPKLKLERAIQEIKSKFIRSYLIDANNEILNDLAHRQQNKDYIKNTTPNVKGDQLFEAIAAKYKSKVILFDFWATWCAPCRNGIEEIKPLKEEMKNKDVVFVYVTDYSSPLQTYNNMISGIKGEHYRITKDEWHYLSQKFNITGIPHQVLVDKNGQVVNSHIEFPSNTELRKMINKELE